MIIVEQELLISQEIPLHASRIIEHLVYNIYETYPHEIHMILFTAISLIFGYSACKEYAHITRTDNGEES